MKCKYCNSEIEGNEKFCPYCGKELQKEVTESVKRSSNGELADTLQPYQKSKSSKKWLWIFLGIILLCGVITSAYFVFSSGDAYTSSDGDESTQEFSMNPDEEIIYRRVEEIYSTVYKGGVLDYQKTDDYDNMFCSYDFLNQKGIYDLKRSDYEFITGFYGPRDEADHWTITSGDCDNRYRWKITDVHKISDEKATAKVLVYYCSNDSSTMNLSLLYENSSHRNNWYIDDFDGEKEAYIESKNAFMEDVHEYFSGYGESYSFDRVRCISYHQMKTIALKELSVSEMNGFAKLLNYDFDKPSIECDYETPRYKDFSSAYFEVHLAKFDGKMLYNFFCGTKDKYEDYFDRLLTDLTEDAGEVMTNGSKYRGIVDGFESVEILRNDRDQCLNVYFHLDH